MVARFGDRTRVTSQVKTWGKDVDAAVDDVEPYEEIFTAPGTWNWPGNVDTVEVTLVGGGGGGGGNFGPTPVNFPFLTVYGAGGGGGVRVERVPVSSPVPVVVGAGGVGGINTSTGPQRGSTVGGSSFFGTLEVGGGGGGGNYRAGSPVGPDFLQVAVDAPPIGGGAGEGAPTNPGVTPQQPGFPGAFGSFGTDVTARGAGSANQDRQNELPSAYLGRFGAGGSLTASLDTGAGTGIQFAAFMNAGLMRPARSGVANTGGGGGGGRGFGTNNVPGPVQPFLPQAGFSGDGGSGIVIVRWTE